MMQHAAHEKKLPVQSRKNINAFVVSVVPRSMHAKRLESVVNATTGATQSARLGISAIGHGLAVVVETKGQEDLDVPFKTRRLRQWCEDINATQSDVEYDFVYVDPEGFEKYAPKSFADVLAGFREYK